VEIALVDITVEDTLQTVLSQVVLSLNSGQRTTEGCILSVGNCLNRMRV
jgi:hypothetical protein